MSDLFVTYTDLAQHHAGVAEVLLKCAARDNLNTALSMEFHIKASVHASLANYYLALDRNTNDDSS